MKTSPIIVAICAGLLFAAFEAAGEDFTVGFNTVQCTGGSDTIVSVPFRRSTSFSGTVSGTPVINTGSATLTVGGSPAFAAGEFTTEAHYLLFTGNGTRSGWVFPITGHDATTITIDLEDDDLSGVADGDAFELVPYWTLGTLFPAATQNTIHVSPNKLGVSRKTRVLFFNDTGDGINLAPDRIYFLTAQGWFLSKRGFPAANDVIIPPGKIFVIRHPVGEVVTGFFPNQVVVEGKYAAPLRTRTAGPQDNPLGLMRPVPVKLSDLDLDAAAFTESSTTDPGNREDELLVFDNVQAALNQQPAKRYFRTGGTWHRDDGGSYPVADNEQISPATGLLIRKAATGTGETQRWLNTPRY